MRSVQGLKKRDLYLEKLVAFRDVEAVKVVTGVRRCGKSSLLRLMAAYLRETGVAEEQILEMNFESGLYNRMSSDEFYGFVMGRAVPGKRMYLFFDEVQHVTGWERAVNALRVDLDSDIYITGSNAYLLSSEYATYLAGRYVEIKMLPLSFMEFIYFNDLELREVPSMLGGNRTIAFDTLGNRYELSEVYDSYTRFGGMPGVSDSARSLLTNSSPSPTNSVLDWEKALVILDGIYQTVAGRDIIGRRKNGVSNPDLLNQIARFLADNIGSSISVSNIGAVLTNEGLVSSDGTSNENKRKGKGTGKGAGKGTTPGAHAAQAYTTALLESFIFYRIARFDIRGKEFLRTLGKFYIVDIGLRNLLLGLRDRDSGHVLENVIYFELLRRGFTPAVGKVDNSEIDFVATNSSSKLYIQVAESLSPAGPPVLPAAGIIPSASPVLTRELSPLLKIRDSFPKLLLSLDGPSVPTPLNESGILTQNALTWLLGQ